MDPTALWLAAVAAPILAAGWLAWLAIALMRAMARYGAAIERHAQALEDAAGELRGWSRADRRARLALIRSVVDLALRRVRHWHQENLMNLVGLGALPDQIDVVPDNAGQALEHAREFSPEAAAALTRAMEELRRCEEQFLVARRVLGRSEREFEKASERLRQRLELAGDDLRRAAEALQAAGAE